MKKTLFLQPIAYSLWLTAFTQNVGIGTTTPLARLHVANGSVVFTAIGDTVPAPGAVPVSGAGRRMMWYADKAAFRAGYANGTNWDNDSIGVYSFAAGFDTKASGPASAAIGASTRASGAISTALGNSTTASGQFSTAMGGGTRASGVGSIAMGGSTTASGQYAAAMGNFTTANSFASTVIGRYNDTTSSSSISWVDTDPLFVAGIGTANNARKNALTISKNGNTGIGTSTPKARLHVTDSSVVFTAEDNASAPYGDPPVSGGGRRMMWYADKAAFRAGYAGGDEWDNANTGPYSIAAGWETTASGLYSTAFGHETIASNYFSTALGNSTEASGQNSIAMGHTTKAMGSSSMAMGYLTVADGEFATAIGYDALADGQAATAIGYVSYALANGATAIGYHVTANGSYSTTIGSYVSSNSYEGSFLIGDHSSTLMMNSPSANNFRARFANGYRLYTSADLSTGCSLGAGDNAWTTGSDVRTKENFEKVNGEDFLQKIAAFDLVSWNYKGQDSRIFRHYGPMAQDFHAAFGKDKYGTIGNDTTINQADFDGVNLIAIQALEKRTREESQKSKVKNEKLEKENARLIIGQEVLKHEIAVLKNQNENLAKRMQQLEALVFNQNTACQTAKQ